MVERDVPRNPVWICAGFPVLKCPAILVYEMPSTLTFLEYPEMEQLAEKLTYSRINPPDTQASLWNQQHFRSFTFTLRLIENSIQTCDLAILCSNLEWAWRCEIRARRLYARITLFWSLNIPPECREELMFHGNRLKQAIRKLESFQKSAAARGVVAHALERNRNAKGPGAKVRKTAKVINFRKKRDARA